MMPPLCRVCGELLLFAEDAAAHLCRCPVCDNFLTRPRPQVNLQSDPEWKQLFRGQPLSQRPIWRREAQLLLDWIHLYQPEGAMLEVGSGTGEFLEVAYENGRDVYGIEETEVGWHHCRRLNVPVFCGEVVQTLGLYGDFRFDSIVLFRSLGLMAHPVQVLTRCRQLLNTHGQIFLEVPNADSADAMRLGDSWLPARLDQHHVHFTERGLRYVLMAAGLHVDSLLSFSARLYCDAKRWKRSKNLALVNGHPWPSLEWIRVVASLADA